MGRPKGKELRSTNISFKLLKLMKDIKLQRNQSEWLNEKIFEYKDFTKS